MTRVVWILHDVLPYLHLTVMEGLKVTRISAGFDTQAVLADESSSCVLKYKTPKFR